MLRLAASLLLAPALLAQEAPGSEPGHPPVSLPTAGAATVERRLEAMGTWLELRLEGGDRAAALAASERAVRAIEACEARLSTWREDSELARLNRAPVGVVTELSPELAQDLARAERLWRATDGAFDPGLGALVHAWGLRTGGRRPSAEELAAAREVGGFAAFELDGRNALRRRERAAIEEGGFGKGIGLDAATDALRAAGIASAVIDLGGQLALLGSPGTTTLADPRDRGRAVLELRLEPGSLATSGNSERGIVVDGVRRGHLLDPRSGEPAEDWGSASVWAADATSADALSTGLYVLGPEAAFRFQARHPEIHLLLLVPRSDGGLLALAGEGWRGRLRALVPGLELAFVAPGAVPSLPPAASSR